VSRYDPGSSVARLKGALVKIAHAFQTFLSDDCGQGLVEYALIITLVAVVAIAGLTLIGSRANSQINNRGGLIPNE